MVEMGNFEENSLYVVPSDLREGSIIANLNMYVVDNETSSFQIQQSVEESFFALSSLPDGILDASIVMVISTCEFQKHLFFCCYCSTLVKIDFVDYKTFYFCIYFVKSIG